MGAGWGGGGRSGGGGGETSLDTQIKQVESAKTLGELQQWVYEKAPRKLDMSVTGFNKLEDAKETVKAALEFHNMYPNMPAARISTMGAPRPGDEAFLGKYYINTKSLITIAPNIGARTNSREVFSKNPKEQLKASKWNSDPTTRGAVTHELGHHLWYNDSSGKLRELANSKEHQKEMISVSGYAKSSHRDDKSSDRMSEPFAESFARAMSGKPKTKLDEEIIRVTKELYG